MSNAKSLSNIQPTPVPQRPIAVNDNYIVGTWLDTWVGTCTITIKKINGSYQMTRLYSDGSGETKFLIVQTVSGTERFIEYPDSPTGDYMLIESGNLVFYDNEGFIYEDYPSNPIEIPTQVDQAIQEIEPTTTTAPTLPPVYVQTGATNKTYINISTGLCLDSNANSAVYTLGCNGGNYQNWESRGENLVNVSTGFCLDSNTEGKVYAISCNGGDYQKWYHSDNRLINVATGLCLDSNANGKVYTLNCNGGNYQSWK